MLRFDPNNCAALLKDGVFDEHDVFGSAFQTKVFLNRFCSANYHTFQQASSDSLNLGVPLGDFFASLGFNDAQQNFEQDYATLCSQQDSFAQSARVNQEVIRIADANLVQAFTACVNQAIFVAYVEPTDAKQFQIIAKFHPPQQGAIARVEALNFDHDVVACDQPPNRIGPEGTVINCHRNDETKAVQLALNTSGGSQSFHVPAIHLVGRNAACGFWNRRCGYVDAATRCFRSTASWARMGAMRIGNCAACRFSMEHNNEQCSSS